MKIQAIPKSISLEKSKVATYLIVTFGTFILELPVSELLHISFHRLLIVSSFWNHKVCHKNRSGRGLKLRNTMGKSDFGLTWPVQLNWSRHRLLPLDRKKMRASFAPPSESGLPQL